MLTKEQEDQLKAERARIANKKIVDLTTADKEAMLEIDKYFYNKTVFEIEEATGYIGRLWF